MPVLETHFWYPGDPQGPVDTDLDVRKAQDEERVLANVEDWVCGCSVQSKN